MSSQRLGLGLSALIDSNSSQEKTTNTEVALDLLTPNPWQPRTDFSKDNLEELASSIKNQGVIQPLLVRELPDNRYQIVAGERRWRAAKIAGLRTIPVYIRHLTDEEVMTAALIENLQREDLNPIEEALALKSLRDKLNLTQEALSAKLSRSRSSVSNAMRLLQLSPEAQEDVKSGRLTAGHARSLLALPEGEICEEARKYIVEKKLSVRETEELVLQWKEKGTLDFLQENTDSGEQKIAKTKEKKKTPTTENELSQKMQSLIEDVLKCKAVVHGTVDKGRITITYKSAEELHGILLALGGETLTEETSTVSEEKKEEAVLPDSEPSQESSEHPLVP